MGLISGNFILSLCGRLPIPDGSVSPDSFVPSFDNPVLPDNIIS
jgi:hypothetical protein